ncbi:carboxypeptidase B-like [Pecten maximus]|uniref:carboxypeptidase B-like n=1 Tax=Pecten maximus TaxID=6579 RepID=UPI001457F94B|nr:carboxypeptidase B-like [Pecten maximus]
MTTVLLLLLAAIVVSGRRYDGHQVLSVFPKLQSDVDAVAALGEELQVDFWHYPHHGNDSFHVRVSPEGFGPFLTGLRNLELSVDVLIDDVQKLIDRETSELRRKRRAKTGPRITDFYTYHNLADIEAHLDDLQSVDNVKITVSQSENTTVDNRRIRIVTMSREGSTDKETIFIDCGIHAREWITPAFCLYLIEMLTMDDVMLDLYDWIIIPVSNPDGYFYSHTFDRMWRKNRRRPNIGNCYGVDLNRNFGYMFGYTGTSSNTCSDIYKGVKAFSESESVTMMNALQSANQVVAYLNVHAFGQYWMTPWGYTINAKPSDYNELKRIASIATAAIAERSGTSYEVGPPGDVLDYSAAGGAYDWAKGYLGVKYSYALELRDKGQYAFLLPEDQIEDTVAETWDGVRAMACAISGNTCN